MNLIKIYNYLANFIIINKYNEINVNVNINYIQKNLI